MISPQVDRARYALCKPGHTEPPSNSHRLVAVPESPWRLVAYGALLGVVKLSLRTVGFARTMKAAVRLAGQHHGPVPVHIGPFEAVADDIAAAAIFFPGRARCLEQSIALYYCLRRLGIPVRFRLGVQPHPFQAHAWVEWSGIPIHEDSETLMKFVPLPALEP